jgi:UDP-N-acetylglucosamine:LPS N-acetylglucosamine transferase
MVKKKILVITDSLPWGHRSIARAIYGFLKSKEKRENIEVYYAEVKAELGLLHEVYMFSYRYFPVSNKLARWMSYVPQLRWLVEGVSKKNIPGLKKVIQKVKPDLIISAHWFHSHSIVKWKDRENLKFKLWSVVTDPWTILPILYDSKIDLHLVYDQKGANLGIKKCHLKESQILETGWWTRGEMFQKYDRNESRKKLGFNDDRPVVFIGGGSLGTYSLVKLLPLFKTIKTKVGVLFNTGMDKKTYNLVEKYIKSFENENIIVRNFGWIENMGEVLAGVDIVFGKAGPNFLFDVVASQKPFVAITHIGGQEDGNIDLIKEKGLGWVKENRNEAANFFINYLKEPKKYENMFKENIKTESERNRKSMEIILKRLKKELEI